MSQTLGSWGAPRGKERPVQRGQQEMEAHSPRTGRPGVSWNPGVAGRGGRWPGPKPTPGRLSLWDLEKAASSGWV